MKHKRTLLFAGLALVASLNAGAQLQSGTAFRQLAAHRQSSAWKTLPGGGRGSVMGAKKVSNTYPRLSANYDGSGTAGGAYANLDSSTYRYTTTAHLGFDLTGSVPQATAGGTILIGDFDTATNYTWSAASSTYSPNFRIVNLYDAQDRQVKQFFQTWAAGTWSDFNRYSSYYNAAGNDTLSLSEDWNSANSTWVPSTRYLTTYDGAANAIKEIVQMWNAGTSSWTNYELDSFAYDANHDETYQLQQMWSSYHNSWYNYSQATFVYSGTFKEQDVKSQRYDTLSSAWNNDYHAHFYYNISDQTIAATSQNGSGATWVNVDSSSYTLLNAGGLPLNTLSFTWSSGWQPGSRITTTNAGAGLPFISVLEAWNGTAFTNANRTTSFYNSYGKPTTVYTEHWNGSAWIVNTSSDNIKRYYYDLISTGVGNVSAGAANIQGYLYPVPASEKINLAVRWSHPEPCTGTICDALGRQVANWTDKPAEFYTREISVASLPAGHYYLRLEGQTECWSHVFAVTH